MVNPAQFRIDDLGDEDGSSSDAIWCQAAPSVCNRGRITRHPVCQLMGGGVFVAR